MLGSELSGIWPRYSDLTDINSADVDSEGGVVVTGDDFGLVKLFRFPCRKKGEAVFGDLRCMILEGAATANSTCLVLRMLIIG